jgi:hypothetical protein
VIPICRSKQIILQDEEALEQDIIAIIQDLNGKQDIGVVKNGNKI